MRKLVFALIVCLLPSLAEARPLGRVFQGARRTGQVVATGARNVVRGTGAVVRRAARPRQGGCSGGACQR